MNNLPPGAWNLPPGVSLSDIPGNGPEETECSHCHELFMACHGERVCRRCEREEAAED